MGASAMLLRCAPGAEHGSAPCASAGRSSVWRKDEKRFMPQEELIFFLFFVKVSWVGWGGV